MSGGARKAALAVARVLALPLRLLPFALRRALVSGLILSETRIRTPGDSLKRLFVLWDDLDLMINERATAYGLGINPKHRLTDYHVFFIDRIPVGSRVLDVGCGVGAVSRAIAAAVEGVSVSGVDFDGSMIARASANPMPSNLTFISGDATRDLPADHWDVIVLSNILEHLEDRITFLRNILVRNSPDRVLIRLPLFERHWHLPLRRELGVPYFSDPTHFIEHTLAEFRREVTAAGLDVIEEKTLWGEIWADCRPAV